MLEIKQLLHANEIITETRLIAGMSCIPAICERELFLVTNGNSHSSM